MLLERVLSVSIYNRNIEVLATEIHKVSKVLSPLFVSDIFDKNSHYYNLQHNSQFFRTLVITGFPGCPIMWNVLPDTYKELPNLTVFKNRIKNENLRAVVTDFPRHMLVEIDFI